MVTGGTPETAREGGREGGGGGGRGRERGEGEGRGGEREMLCQLTSNKYIRTSTNKYTFSFMALRM